MLALALLAAYLPGSDPLLESEFVVYTAHLDHIGELHGEGHDDAINNGALDNATGVAQIVELTEQLRGAAGERQVKKARRGLAQNMGGTGASSVVHILEAM